MRKDERIFVAGHRGLVGSAIVRRLQSGGFGNLVLRGHDQLDLRDAAAVDRFYREERPDCTIMAAAKVGGILANQTFPAEFIRDNLAIQTHLIHSAWEHGTRKLLFLGSSCIYPRDCPQPIREEYLLSGPLEPTNEAYAIAKIAGLKMCQAYRRQYGFDAIVAMPTNLYGPGDNFHPEQSHVLPALMRRIHEAQLRGDNEVVIWGSGTPRREFLHVDDLASAVLFLLERYSGHDCVNVGTGEDLSILELAGMIADVVGFKGGIALDRSKPDGTPRKLLAVDRLRNLGWSASISLRSGIADTYRWFLAHQDQVRA
jgi:GDP-L-fucose synthase